VSFQFEFTLSLQVRSLWSNENAASYKMVQRVRTRPNQRARCDPSSWPRTSGADVDTV